MANCTQTVHKLSSESFHFPLARTKTRALNPDNFSDVCDQTGVTLNRYMIEVGSSGMKAKLQSHAKAWKAYGENHMKSIEFENHMNLWWFTGTALCCIALHHAASRSWQANRQGVVDTDILSVTDSALTAFALGVSCPFGEPLSRENRRLKTFHAGLIHDFLPFSLLIWTWLSSKPPKVMNSIREVGLGSTWNCITSTSQNTRYGWRPWCHTPSIPLIHTLIHTVPYDTAWYIR